jgi:tRNA(adenine34) deaminase
MKLKFVELSGCTMYTSLEPCPMCCWAIIDARIGTPVMGGRYAVHGRKDMGRYSVESFFEFMGRPLEVVTGIRARECEDLRRSWEAEQQVRKR